MTLETAARRRLGVLAVVATLGVTAACQQPLRPAGAPTEPLTVAAPTTPSPAPAAAPTSPAAPPTVTWTVIGRSRNGRPITAEHVGSAAAPALLVVGCIHGNEPAGIAVVTALAALAQRRDVNLWLIPTMNPDGQRAGTRGNAAGVDLNRNFPYRWQPIGRPGSLHWSGPHPLSEPESIAVARLIRAIRPRWAIWFHQALDLIDDSEGPAAVERRLAVALRMRERALPDYPGSAVGFTDHRQPRSAFVIELPPGALSPGRVRQIAVAVLDATYGPTVTAPSGPANPG